MKIEDREGRGISPPLLPHERDRVDLLGSMPPFVSTFQRGGLDWWSVTDREEYREKSV